MTCQLPGSWYIKSGNASLNAAPASVSRSVFEKSRAASQYKDHLNGGCTRLVSGESSVCGQQKIVVPLARAPSPRQKSLPLEFIISPQTVKLLRRVSF